MPLPEADLAALEAAQRLCNDVQDDVRTLASFVDWLEKADARRARLTDFYEKDWLRLAESPELDSAQSNRIEALVRPGEYSILGQDTVWDALSDLREEYLALLKALATKL